MDEKPKYQSKIIAASAVSIIATMSMMFGVDLGLTPEVQTKIVEGIVLIASAATVVFRVWFTSTKLT